MEQKQRDDFASRIQKEEEGAARSFYKTAEAVMPRLAVAQEKQIALGAAVLAEQSRTSQSAVLGVTSLVSTQFLGGWLAMVRSGLELWARFPEEVAKGIHAADEDLRDPEDDAPEPVPEKRAAPAKSPNATAQTPEELYAYQREMIRQDAYHIAIQRKATGAPGDDRTDWEEAERRYYSNN